MRGATFAVFISIALLVYSTANYYIFIRGWQAVPNVPWLRTAYIALFILSAGSFIAGRFLERMACTHLTTAIVWIGSFWLAFMLYFFLSAVVFDILRLSNALFHWWPQTVRDHYQAIKLATLGLVITVTAIAVIAGYYNALRPRVVRLKLDIHKSAGSRKELRIVMASDIHLGTIIGNGRLAQLVELINRQEPDIICLAGDIVDEDIGPVIRDNLGETLRKLRSTYGVFAVTGNHEYIGGVKESVKYLRDHGVTMLLDSVAQAGGIAIAGRIDRSGRRFDGRPRLALAELIKDADRTRPLILLDHQPFELSTAENAGVDLQLSGHCHDGQLWPLNYITNKVYELSWGYKKKGNTHFYVSSGYGTWGPPVRIGNTPEIVVITLHFTH